MDENLMSERESLIKTEEEQLAKISDSRDVLSSIHVTSESLKEQIKVLIEIAKAQSEASENIEQYVKRTMDRLKA